MSEKTVTLHLTQGSANALAQLLHAPSAVKDMKTLKALVNFADELIDVPAAPDLTDARAAMVWGRTPWRDVAVSTATFEGLKAVVAGAVPTLRAFAPALDIRTLLDELGGD